MSEDLELDAVVSQLIAEDPSGERYAKVFRETFDQLYDGQRTGRYKWDQLFKTEKTHFGTLIEINLQREFEFHDGKLFDYEIAGAEVDCKYSFNGGWMLPPESWDQLIMVATADDAQATWSIGVVRVTAANRRTSVNRDGKSSLSPEGRLNILWVFRDASMPGNVLLQLPPADVDAIFSKKPGQQRLDELFRRAQGVRIHRSSVATVAQQFDYMKRVRYNGGSRSNLRGEGFLILGGDYGSHRELANQFAVPVPRPGEFVSLRVVAADNDDSLAVRLDAGIWRKARDGERSSTAPMLPSTKRSGEGDPYAETGTDTGS